MMVTSSYDQRRHATLKGHIERLERLAADLKMLTDGPLPPEECLHAAPLLDSYKVTTAEVFCLTGWVDRHPTLGGPRTILTSPIWLMADDLTWARTYSRYYRLGRPMEDTITVN